MLTDPQTITVNAVAKAMPRVKQDGLSSLYQLADETFKLEVSHQTNQKKGETFGRVRSLVRFTQRAIVTNPLDSSNDYDTLSIQLVVDRPNYGFTSAQLDQLRAGFFAWLDTTMTGKIFGQES